MIETDQRPQQRAIGESGIAWPRVFGLVAMHVGCLGVFWVGYSLTTVIAAVAMYLIRAFALTAFYHRYFSHRAFKTSRWFQFVGALVGTMALQKGPLWWSAHHRHHHRESDEVPDVHSPKHFGFLWSHFGWILAERHSDVREDLVRDWLRFPELRMLERFSMLIGLVFVVLVYAIGEALNYAAPTLATDGASLVVWVVFVSTVALYHATYSVNSFAHLFGTRRFVTDDNSRNNLIVALLTLGEGWHNNHHRYQSSARQGFVWWEIDLSYYVLLLFERCGLVWELRPVPEQIMDSATSRSKHPPIS